MIQAVTSARQNGSMPTRCELILKRALGPKQYKPLAAQLGSFLGRLAAWDGRALRDMWRGQPPRPLFLRSAQFLSDCPDLADDNARHYWVILKRRLSQAIAKRSFEFHVDADVGEWSQWVTYLRQRIDANLVDELTAGEKSWSEELGAAGNGPGDARP
jgi:hypothetical protein